MISHKTYQVLSSTVLIAVSFGSLFSAPSDLDTSFGVGGIASLSPNNNSATIEEILPQPDGKIVAIGRVFNADRDFAVARFHPDGKIDSSFGVNGLVVTALLGEDPVSTGVVQPDGKIIAAGGSYKHFAMVRYTPDGRLDPTFGNNGIVVTDVGVSFLAAIINAVAIQPDGKIVAAGNCHTWDICVARYLPDGMLDQSFGNGGFISTRYAANGNEAHAIALQPNGKILVGARVIPDKSGGDSAVFRFNTDGSFDNTFDGDGVSITQVGLNDHVTGMILRPDGKIITVGNSAPNESTSRFALIRYNSDGSRDTTFGENGIAFLGNPLTNGTGRAAVQPDGKIVVVAGRNLSGQAIAAFQIARFNSNGSPDTTFGNNGSRNLTMRTQGKALSLLIQPDGKVVGGGYGVFERGGGFDFAVVRYIGGDSSLPAEASISGQVLLDGGVRFKGGAHLMLTGGTLKYPLYAQTNPFGFFHFPTLPTDHEYQIRPASKTYLFVEPSQSVLLNDTVSDVYIVSYRHSLTFGDVVQP